MLTLRNWYLKEWRAGSGIMIAHGDVYGHYRQTDGLFIHTSRIEKAYLAGIGEYDFLTASGSVYHVKESELDEQGKECTKALLDKLAPHPVQSAGKEEQLAKAREAFERRVAERDERAEKAIEQMEDGELYLQMDGSCMQARRAVCKYEGTCYEIKPYTHVGTFQDSEIIRDLEHGKIDFRHFPQLGLLNVYFWSEELQSVYIHNVGAYHFFLDKSYRHVGKCPAGEVTKITREEYINGGMAGSEESSLDGADESADHLTQDEINWLLGGGRSDE